MSLFDIIEFWVRLVCIVLGSTGAAMALILLYNAIIITLTIFGVIRP